MLSVQFQVMFINQTHATGSMRRGCVQVRVVHQGSVHLPLRVGVFAVTQEDRSRIQEWLPSEFVPVMELHDSDELVSSPGKRKKTTRKADKLPLEERLRRRGLKTHTVLSHVFQSPDNNQVQALRISNVPSVWHAFDVHEDPTCFRASGCRVLLPSAVPDSHWFCAKRHHSSA